jgi:hypothetical protein
MEASSPLAAMQPPSFMPTWSRNDLYTSHTHSHISGANNFGPGAFNFKDLSMKRSSKQDYFAMKPIRGSSPTASLAADLSQNFHIDMRYVCLLQILRCSLTCCSPQLPTPRRSLFTSNLFGTIDGRGKILHWQIKRKLLTIGRICYDTSFAILFSWADARTYGYFAASPQTTIPCSTHRSPLANTSTYTRGRHGNGIISSQTRRSTETH